MGVTPKSNRTDKDFGVMGGGFGGRSTGAGLGSVDWRAYHDQSERNVAGATSSRNLVLTQVPMTDSGGTLSAATDVGDGEQSVWHVEAHATVSSGSPATGTLRLALGDSGHWPGDPGVDLEVSVGPGNGTATLPLSGLVIVSGYVNASYTPDTGTIEAAWLVWRAYRLGPV